MKMKSSGSTYKIMGASRLITMAVRLSLLTICIAIIHGMQVNAEKSAPEKPSAAEKPVAPEGSSGQGVTLNVTDKEVVIDNGIIKLTIANPEGYVTAISYNGVQNILAKKNEASDRGYYDTNWDMKGFNGTDWFLGSSFKAEVENENQVEVSFKIVWDPAAKGGERMPANVDRRYVVLKGSSGFYSYLILERLKGWPAMNVEQIRAVFKLDRDQFHYMAVSDDLQRIMPMPQDRDNGDPLAFKEAVLLNKPMNLDFKGEVDDKYMYACDDKDNKVHGWVSTDPQIGFWVITASNEFRTAGPVKQDLTSHVGPITLQMFHSAHYAGDDVLMTFQEGEPWKMVYGPFFVYLNTAPKDKNPRTLWDDAKQQMEKEQQSWPYEFPASKDFPKAAERGTVSGRLQVRDSYGNATLAPASSAWVGLAAPGEAGSWQVETKGYQFWTQADKDGAFSIKAVREGVYKLYAFVPGVIGDYVYDQDVKVAPGAAIKMDDLVYEPPRSGPTLWEIGIPDRTAHEFFVPEPNKNLANKLFASEENRYRQYGLWDRYAELYPDKDLVFTVGTSDYRKDWFFAQVTRRLEGTTYNATTWQIVFPLKEVVPSANYTMRLALAAATRSDVQVRFNDEKARNPVFSTTSIGTDNAIARHGIHGLYRLFSFGVPSELLRQGDNTVFLRQSKHDGPFVGVMYDYLRLEGPPSQKP